MEAQIASRREQRSVGPTRKGSAHSPRSHHLFPRFSKQLIPYVFLAIFPAIGVGKEARNTW